MKRKLSLLLAIAMCFSLVTACGSSNTTEESNSSSEATESTSAESSSSTEESENTATATSDVESKVTVAIGGDPGSLSPFSGNSTGGNQIKRTLYEYLIDLVDGEPVNCLMESYEMVSDLVVDITIYDYIHDTDGNPLTASDVAFSYNTAKELGNVDHLDNMLRCEAIDDYVVEVEFEDLKLGDLEEFLLQVPIVTQAAYEASEDAMAATPVGTTGYRLTNFVSGSSLTFEATHDYWQTDESQMSPCAASNVDTIVFDVITEDAQVAISLQSGDIDVASIVQASDVYHFEEGGDYADGFTVYPYMENGIQEIMFNCSDSSPCQDQYLREAICYAIDPEAIVQATYNGDASVAHTFGVSKMVDYNSAWDDEDYYSYDLDKAKELMAQSAYADGVTLHILGDTDDRNTSMMTIIQAQLAEIGITVVQDAYEKAMADSLRMQEDQWDILIGAANSNDYLVNCWKLVFNATDNGGHTIGFVEDDTLQELLDICRDPNTFTQEAVDNFHYYLKDMCYAYALCETYASAVANASIMTDYVCDYKNNCIPGACTYVWN